jgi:hypothetical protein
MINALGIMFQFFSMGFSQAIFGAGTNPDGTVDYSFDYTTPIGQIMMLTLIAALIMFFINFLLTFRTNDPIDASGQPTKSQTTRLFYLK